MNVLFRWFTRLHIKMFRATGGKIGGSIAGGKVLLLTTQGHKSGQPRTVPLVYFEHQGKVYVVGSAGGAPDHPAWYKNLAARPEVTVEIGARRLEAQAVTVDQKERTLVFDQVKKQMTMFAGYEKKATQRTIPIVRLDGVVAN